MDYSLLIVVCVLSPCLLLNLPMMQCQTATPPLNLKDIGPTDENKVFVATVSNDSLAVSTATEDFLWLEPAVTPTTTIENFLQPTPSNLPFSSVGTYSREATPVQSDNSLGLPPLIISASTDSIVMTPSYLNLLTTTSVTLTMSSIILPTLSSEFLTDMSTVLPTSSVESVQNSSTVNTTLISSSSPSSTKSSPTVPLSSSSTSSSQISNSTFQNLPTTSTPDMAGSTQVFINITTGNSTATTSNELSEEDKVQQSINPLSTAAIIGIGFAAAAVAIIIIGATLVLMKRKVYRRNKQDPSNFWDDNVTLSYINSHADFPKEFDAEMMSLDDDSFLNSLDSMTFANLWATDTAKHTNF